MAQFFPPPAQAQGASSMGVQLFGPSGGAIWSAPTIDVITNSIYATTGDSYSGSSPDTSDAFVAFDTRERKAQMVTADDRERSL